MPASPLASLGDQLRLPQHPKMLGDRRTAHRETAGKLASGQRPGGEPYRVLAGLLLIITAVFAAQHSGAVPALARPPEDLILVGLGALAGFGIGVVSAVLGVAGGELFIPTLVLLYGVDLKLAGSLSILVSLPTMLVVFARYSRPSLHRADHSPRLCRRDAAGSLTGALFGGLLFGRVPDTVLVPLVVGLLLASALKVWRHWRAKP